MNVLLLPTNNASDLSHKVRALRAIGINARGLVLGESPVQSAVDVKTIQEKYTTRTKAYRTFSQVAWWMCRWLAWADFVHWVCDFRILPHRWDIKIVKWFDRPAVVQWVGSDIRIPEIDAAVNPYYAQAFSEGYEYSDESRERSLRTQRDFADLNFYPLEFVGMGHYIEKDLFPKRFRTWQSVVLSEHEPAYPDAATKKPLIVHSPTAPVAKGTKYVLAAIDKLKEKCDFEFALVQNMPRREALKMAQRCDVFVDQLVLGSHGSAATEAMAFGKPVVCYIDPIVGKDYPTDLPIVNANPDNITEQLEVLIQNAALRREIGLKSRKYVEKYHDDKKIAHELVEIYREVVRLHKARKK